MGNFLHILLAGVVIGVAAYALATLIAWERGPWAIFEKIRSLAPPGSEMDYLLSCEACQGLWFVIFFMTLAFSGGALVLPNLASVILCGVFAYGVHLFLGRKSVFR